jgi:transcriptional regulator NrdR family protein
MGSPISSTTAEIYLQYLENIYIKHWLDSKEILFYKRYVDDILMAYDEEKIDEQIISQIINGIDNKLHFKMTTEVNSTINYLDILIRRNIINITMEMYRNRQRQEQ